MPIFSCKAEGACPPRGGVCSDSGVEEKWGSMHEKQVWIGENCPFIPSIYIYSIYIGLFLNWQIKNGWTILIVYIIKWTKHTNCWSKTLIFGSYFANFCFYLQTYIHNCCFLISSSTFLQSSVPQWWSGAPEYFESINGQKYYSIPFM